MTLPRSVVVVGESIAGITAARELRTHGFAGPITVIGDDPDGSYSRPVLSKDVLRDSAAESGIGYSVDDLGLKVIRGRAISLDATTRVVATGAGQAISYDALIVATGAAARRLAKAGQGGECVLRTLGDARALRSRLAAAKTVVVVGAGFLGMEVASACVARGVQVTLIDIDPPLQRVLGPFLSEILTRRSAAHGLKFVQSMGPVDLVGDQVYGVRLPEGSVISADLVVTCVGDSPATDWLAGTGLADDRGIPVDEACRTSIPGVFAAGDVCYLASADRAPFWSNAVAQARVAAASVLGLASPCTPRDDYFWSEILKLSLKIVGPLPVVGAPTHIDGDIESGDALLRWEHSDGSRTVVALGRRVSVGRLRGLARPALDGGAGRHGAIG